MFSKELGTPNKAIILPIEQCTDSYLKYYGDNFIAFGLPKAKADDTKEYLKDILELIPHNFPILVASTDIFKVATKVKKVTALEGVAVNQRYFIIPSPLNCIYNPSKKTSLKWVMDNVEKFIAGNYDAPGTNIIHSSRYIYDVESLDFLHEYSMLTCDIETAGLKFTDCGVLSIAFAWSEHDGVAIHVNNNEDWFKELKKFFENYKGQLVFHNATFDTKVLIHNLWVGGQRSWRERMPEFINGLDIMYRNLHDTKVIAYLAVNSCSGNELGLKKLSQQFSGNYGIDVSGDNTSIPVNELLEYNLKDCLSTMWVYNKYYPMMVSDNQLGVYESVFRPTLKVLTQTEYTGLCIDQENLKQLSQTLHDKYNDLLNSINTNPEVLKFQKVLDVEYLAKQNTKRKNPKFELSEKEKLAAKFNVNSNIQLGRLLFEHFNLEPLEYTDKGAYSVKADVLEELTSMHSDIPLLNDISEYLKLNKIMTSFMPSFENADPDGDVRHLYGSFHLGGTKSGRLSSSDPNLQNLPSTGSLYAKPVKDIFRAPPGYVYVGSDFASLEDRISALTTKDENKLKVYTSGADGHSLRAYYYFKKYMQDIKQVPLDTKCYKVEHDDGTVEYLTEKELEEKEYK